MENTLRAAAEGGPSERGGGVIDLILGSTDVEACMVGKCSSFLAGGPFCTMTTAEAACATGGGAKFPCAFGSFAVLATAA